MVVGDQNLQPQVLRGLHALHTGDAVIDRDQERGASRGHTLANGRCQAIAVLHAIRHQIADILRAQQAQATHGDSAGGCAITVIIGDDADVFLIFDGS